MIELSHALAQALAHHRAGRLGAAECGYREILDQDPNHVESLHLWGLVAAQSGRSDLAIAAIGRALQLRPDDPGMINSLGLALKAAGRAVEAEAQYRRALALAPNYGNAHNSLALTLQAEGRLEEAIGHYRQALACDPTLRDAAYHLAAALQQQGQAQAAAEQYLAVLAVVPDHAEAHNNLGNLLTEAGKLDEAVAHLERAAALQPEMPEVHYNLATALQRQGRRDQAVAHYQRALALRPGYAKAHNNLGTALQALGRLSQAVRHYREAAALRPDWTDPTYNLGTVFQQEGLVDEAAACQERVLALEPGHAKAAFALCIAQLPLIYADSAEIPRRRAAYRHHLLRLAERLEERAGSPELEDAVGASQPFYLAYQGLSDRDLQGLYGALVYRLMARSQPPVSLPPPPGAHEPVRVGLVSGFFRAHSNWKVPIKGWLSELDRSRFQVFCYHTGPLQDAETAHAATLCRRFVQGPLPLAQWRREILADQPHVLIYPEVGMDPMAARLAAQRLARHQCNAWGHPETSGFPTLDSFLSSDLMEPADGQDHYTERLIRLPNLSIHYRSEPVRPVALERRDLGLRPEATVYWCGQALFKYLPDFDEVFPRIARGVGDCQFVFINYARGDAVTAVLRTRLDAAFAAFGLSAADFCVFLPPADSDRFVASIGLCDIVLDSIGWSGCNTTLESLHHDLPIVTLPTGLMRGRHGLAILAMMDVTETIADSVPDYVAKAVRLAHDRPWRQTISGKIARSKHRLFGDRSCITALEDFLERAARDYRRHSS